MNCYINIIQLKYIYLSENAYINIIKFIRNVILLGDCPKIFYLEHVIVLLFITYNPRLPVFLDIILSKKNKTHS